MKVFIVFGKAMKLALLISIDLIVKIKRKRFGRARSFIFKWIDWIGEASDRTSVDQQYVILDGKCRLQTTFFGGSSTYWQYKIGRAHV